MTNGLQFSVDQTGPIAVYIQVENLIQFAIASGSIKRGDPLPSVRNLSSKLKLNPNTITKAYRDLELMGLVDTRRGVGVRMSDGARQLCKKRVQDMVKQHLRHAIGECGAAGFRPAQIRKITSEAISSGYTPYASGDHS